MLAARNLFAEFGYDATTLRQVAQRADLGLGTLFNYISDKRDLIYLVFNQEVSAVTSASLAAPRPWQTFNEKILSMFEPNYRLFGSEPVLSRILLSEVLQHTPGLHLAEHLGIRDRFIRGLEEVVARAQQSGEIGSTESPQLIARHIFFCYASALRWWLAASEAPEWRAGMRDLAEVLRLQTSGLDLRTASQEGTRSLMGKAAAVGRGEARTVARVRATLPEPPAKRARPLQTA